MFKYDSTGVNMDRPGFTPAPEGNYTLMIKEVEEKTTKKGNNMVSCICEIDTGEHIGKKIWHNVTFLDKGAKGAGMAIHFLKTINEPWEGEFDVNPNDWIGKTFNAHLIIEKDLKGRDRNVVGWVIGLDDDEVPF